MICRFCHKQCPGALAVSVINAHSEVGEGYCPSCAAELMILLGAALAALGKKNPFRIVADTSLSLESLRNLPYREYLETDHWKQVREKALRRAKNRCSLCNGAGTLNVHHRTYQNLGAEMKDDLIVLCRDCHAKHHDKLASEPKPEKPTKEITSRPASLSQHPDPPSTPITTPLLPGFSIQDVRKRWDGFRSHIRTAGDGRSAPLLALIRECTVRTIELGNPPTLHIGFGEKQSWHCERFNRPELQPFIEGLAREFFGMELRLKAHIVGEERATDGADTLDTP